MPGNPFLPDPLGVWTSFGEWSADTSHDDETCEASSVVLMFCKCKASKCKTGCCSCMKAQIPCTAACGCLRSKDLCARS